MRPARYNKIKYPDENLNLARDPGMARWIFWSRWSWSACSRGLLSDPSRLLRSRQRAQLEMPGLILKGGRMSSKSKSRWMRGPSRREPPRPRLWCKYSKGPAARWIIWMRMFWSLFCRRFLLIQPFWIIFLYQDVCPMVAWDKVFISNYRAARKFWSTKTFDIDENCLYFCLFAGENPCSINLPRFILF